MCHICLFFFFNDTATTEIYTLSLHDALPISTLVVLENGRLVRDTTRAAPMVVPVAGPAAGRERQSTLMRHPAVRSEEHTSELQSRLHLVCRLLLEKKKTKSFLISYTVLYF